MATATMAPQPQPINPKPQPRPIVTTPTPAVKASRLGSVKRGPIDCASRWLVYGQAGVGKSSLAANAPDAIFLDIEGGSKYLDVARYQFSDGDGGFIPRYYTEVLDAIKDLATASHPYKTVVIDTIDALEAMQHRWICEVEKVASIENVSGGFGKGYTKAVEEWRLLSERLDLLIKRGISVVLLGHSLVKSFSNPIGEDYDRYLLRMHEKSAAHLIAWCDSLGFLRFDEGAAKLPGDKSKNARARGYYTGCRILHFDKSAAWEAKTRLAIPREIVLDATNPWAPLQTSIGMLATDFLPLIAAEMQRLGGLFVKANGDVITTEDIIESLRGCDANTHQRALEFLKSIETVNKSEEGKQ